MAESTTNHTYSTNTHYFTFSLASSSGDRCGVCLEGMKLNELVIGAKRHNLHADCCKELYKHNLHGKCITCRGDVILPGDEVFSQVLDLLVQKIINGSFNAKKLSTVEKKVIIDKAEELRASSGAEETTSDSSRERTVEEIALGILTGTISPSSLTKREKRAFAKARRATLSSDKENIPRKNPAKKTVSQTTVFGLSKATLQKAAVVTSGVSLAVAGAYLGLSSAGYYENAL